MLKVSALVGRRVLVHKKTKTAKDGTVTDSYTKLGKVHAAVFSPDGKRVVGFTVKRPDVAGMIKREDAFLAADSFSLAEKDVMVTRATDGLDIAAVKRLGLDWDACIMWSGMDARTTDGKPLGYVSDAEFDEKTGRVTRFMTADGGMARALIGSFVITPDMVRGYKNGRMVIDATGRTVELDGGLAGAAGEGYARAKAKGAELGKKAGAVAGEAVDKGSFALGRMIGKARRAVSEATAPEQEPAGDPVPALDVRVEKPAERIAEKSVDPASAPKAPEPKTYAPAPKAAKGAAGAKMSEAKPKSGAAKSAAAKAKPAPAKKRPATTGEQVARAAGKQLSGLGKMFGSFKDEFDKASKGK